MFTRAKAVFTITALALGSATVVATQAFDTEETSLESLRVELVRSRGFIRAADTQLTKTLAIVDSLLAQQQADSVVIDSVYLLPDSVITLEVGDSVQLCAVAHYSDGEWGVDPDIEYCRNLFSERHDGAQPIHTLAYWSEQ